MMDATDAKLKQRARALLLAWRAPFGTRGVDRASYSFDDLTALEIDITDALRAVEREMFTPLQWQALWDALAFTAQHAGCVSDAHDEAVDIVEAFLAECRARAEQQRKG